MIDRPLSFSTMKLYADCPAAGYAKEIGEWKLEQTQPMLAGQYGECALCTPDLLQGFIEANKSIMKKTGKGKLKVFSDLDKTIAVLRADEEFMQYIKGDMQIKLTGSIRGVEMVGYADFIDGDTIRDLKIIKDVHEMVWDEKLRCKVPVMKARKYDWQVALYRYLAKVKHAEILAVNKDISPQRVLVQLSGQDLHNAEQAVFAMVELIKGYRLSGGDYLDECGECDYCKSNRSMEVIQW